MNSSFNDKNNCNMEIEEEEYFKHLKPAFNNNYLQYKYNGWQEYEIDDENDIECKYNGLWFNNDNRFDNTCLSRVRRRFLLSSFCSLPLN